MKTFAYVVFTVIAPAEFEGEQFMTTHPEPCEQFMDRTMEMFRASGWDVMGQCHYTFAPLTSPRPKTRPTTENE